MWTAGTGQLQTSLLPPRTSLSRKLNQKWTWDTNPDSLVWDVGILCPAQPPAPPAFAFPLGSAGNSDRSSKTSPSILSGSGLPCSAERVLLAPGTFLSSFRSSGSSQRSWKPTDWRLTLFPAVRGQEGGCLRCVRGPAGEVRHTQSQYWKRINKGTTVGIAAARAGNPRLSPPQLGGQEHQLGPDTAVCRGLDRGGSGSGGVGT